jgi:hypothetical protein
VQSIFLLLLLQHSLTKEHTESQKKLKDPKLEADKKTFLKAQLPKMESEMKRLKVYLADLLEEEELDPRGEYFVMAQKLVK